MSERSSQTERLLTLTCVLLASERGLTKNEIYEVVRGYHQQLQTRNMVSLTKLFERDKDILRDLGVQLEVITPEHSPDDHTEARYRISQQDFTWPADLKFSSRQMALLELAARAWSRSSLSEPAERGLTKLKALGVSQFQDLIGFAPQLRTPDRNFDAISYAIANNQQIAFQYRKLDAPETKNRIVEPWKLRQLQGEWVMLGNDQEAGSSRNFLLRRIIGEISTLPEVFEIDEASVTKAEIELDGFIQSNKAILEITPGSEAEFTFGESGEIEISYMDEQLFSEDILELGNAVKVVQPESLRKRVISAYHQVVNLHA